MKQLDTDITIIGAGPVGLLSAYLAQRCGLETVILDKSDGPLDVGRADALNARTLQLLEIVGLFDELYPLGKPCNTSSVWADGKFQSRQSAWWDELEGCKHKHFLMLGQAYVEQLIDRKLTEMGAGVLRNTTVKNVQVLPDGVRTELADDTIVSSKYVIGADGSRSMVRQKFGIPFEIVRPEIVWAVIDGVIDTDFEKVPEIIVFQAETSDVAWIPREGNIDRFYIRMDRKDFSMEDAIAKINRAMAPHSLSFKEVVWFSQFSVKESVAENYLHNDRVILAGDACHVHSVNGGQGLNTGLADAFNLIWKLDQIIHHNAPATLLTSYEQERKPVAESVVATSGELVRSTKFSAAGTHAKDYVNIVRKRSGNVTGMGIRYGDEGLVGERLYDFDLQHGDEVTRLYSKLDYNKYTLLVHGRWQADLELPDNVQVIRINCGDAADSWHSDSAYYEGQAVLVRPDGYIAAVGMATDAGELLAQVVN